MAMVRYRENELPPLTPERETELKALMEMPDSEIDFSDMPELDDDFFKNAIPGRFYKPTKKHMSLRIDSDVVAWFQRQGKGYQSRLNAILREAMLRERGIN